MKKYQKNKLRHFTEQLTYNLKKKKKKAVFERYRKAKETVPDCLRLKDMGIKCNL